MATIVEIPAKRHARILEHLRATGAASVHELVRAVGGSPSTIRRDLDHLVERGYLERTRGGVLLPQMPATFEREPALKLHLQTPQKQAIGIAAAERLSPRDSVILDGSTTVKEAMVAAAARGLSLTVVTNGLDISLAAAAVPNWRVILPGGTVRSGSDLLAGESAIEFLSTVHADVCLMGVYAISGNLLTDTSLEVAAVKKAMMRAARRTIVLADSSKFQPPTFATFGAVSEVDEIITDEHIAHADLDNLKSLARKVTVVSLSVVAPR